MIVLNQSNQDVLRQLGGTQIKTKGKKYRINKYCLEQDIPEGKLIYNFFTGASVMIKPFEYINIYTDDPCDYAEFLVKNYFIVPEDFEEQPLVDLIRERQRLPITPNYLDHPNKFVILSTTRCNARCFYCYEMQSKGKTHMTYETAEKVAKYIMEVIPKGSEIELSWFGGEPLYNMDVIELITSRISSAGIKFRGSMISNGYLFDEKIVQKAKYEWHITNIQITLDGTEEVYNKIKNYIYKDDVSPYKKVIENIGLLLDQDIAVSVRMNCDSHNFENLKELIVELDNIFKHRKNFSMYAWPIFEEGFTRTPEEKKILYNSVTELEKMMFDLGYPVSHQLTHNIKGTHCMVDTGSTVTINPKGDLGMCEHYIDRNFVGHIDRPYEKNMDIIKGWREYIPATELCNDCPIYPQCLKMKGCPDEIPCEEHQKKYWIEHNKLAIQGEWIMNQTKQQCNNGKCGDNKNNEQN